MARRPRRGQRVNLTAQEFALLALLPRRQGEVLSKTRIGKHLWDSRYDGLSNTLEVRVSELRRIRFDYRPGSGRS